MQDGEGVAITCKDKRTRIAMVRKVPRNLAIVVDDDLPGLESEVGADIGVHARVAAQCKLGRVAVLGDDIKGLAILVLCVGIEDEAASQSVTDGELEVGWDCPTLANGSDGPEEILELTGAVLVS